MLYDCYISVCEDVYYGHMCNMTCGLCKDGHACDKQNGTCFNGCATNFQQPQCKGNCNNWIFFSEIPTVLLTYSFMLFVS